MLEEDIQKIIELRHDTPYEILGPHYAERERALTIRAFLPQAEQAYLLLGNSTSKREMQRIHPDGLFSICFPSTTTTRHNYQIMVVEKDGQMATFHDPYAICNLSFTPEDGQALKQGKLNPLFEKLGAHPKTKQGMIGVNFTIWAPNASRISVVGQFNHWDGRRHPLERHKSGVWEIFIPGIGPGEIYKYEVRNQGGDVFIKSDPLAFEAEVYPKSAAFICDIRHQYNWNDDSWMVRSKEISDWNLPISIHRVSFSTKDINSCELVTNYKQLRDIVLPYLIEGRFTHVELTLWEAEDTVASYYAPNPRYGRLKDLMAFIDESHQNGIGIILNWIPPLLPKVGQELSWFDGSRLYDTDVLDQRDVLGFRLERHEVQNFLVANAIFWNQIYHIDALCTDARTYTDRLSKSDLVADLRFLIRENIVKPTLSVEESILLTQVRHTDPHTLLGPHPLPEPDLTVVRALLPAATGTPFLLLQNKPGLLYQLQAAYEGGLFEAIISDKPTALNYQINATEYGWNNTFYDPYATAFSILGDQDCHLFAQGNHYRIYEKLGAHLYKTGDLTGINFAVWAPNAKRISVVGPFNHWDGRRHPMRLRPGSGIWELFIPELSEDELYKFEILPNSGPVFLKTDPFGFHTEIPPGTACVVYDVSCKHVWKDDLWIQQRSHSSVWQQPISIYEVHAGSWRRKANGEFLSYLELADQLIPYILEMGFTHIEFLPLAEHPYGPSWGYQISNFYAPTARYGRPEELMELIDRCHQNGIGVILDWVPAHFPKDAHAMAWFDGTCLFEHADPRQGEHPDWGTLIFNYGRNEVRNFLIANALYWLKVFHFDGLRVDAVASMLYLDYSKKDWIPNKYGGNQNLEAIEFLSHINAVVHADFPGVMMIAEESTAWPNVSRPTDIGGLGFGFKWNMGWMHDVLSYMQEQPEHRCHHHHKLNFGITYAFNENFILSLSHDEVVHLKKSMLGKMPGNKQQQFANLRLLYAFMYGHPGKKLLFMGGEFGQLGEWNSDSELEWVLSQDHQHQGLQRFIGALNKLYAREAACHQVDFQGTGFEWVDANGAKTSVLSFLRKARDPRDSILFVLNFSDCLYRNYRIGVPYPSIYRELLHSDAKEYAGSGKTLSSYQIPYEDISSHGFIFSIVLDLPPLSAVILKPEPFSPLDNN